MLAYRFRFALAALSVSLLQTAVGVSQEASPPTGADPTSSAAGANPSANSLDPLLGAEPPSDAAGSSDSPPAETQAPKLAAKVLLIETDWRKANDRSAASRLAHSLSNSVFDDDRAGTEVFPPGYATMFQGDDARRISDDLQRLGLVRQSMPLSAVELNLAEQGVEALGAATVSFQETASDGQRESVVWNVLVVTEPAPALLPSADPFSPRATPSVDPFSPSGAPPASPRATYRVALVSWKDRTAAKLQSQEEVASEGVEVVRPAADVASEESERYVGSFKLSTDQSTVVPLALPGLKGAMIDIGPVQEGPAVRSLGPLAGALQKGLSADFSVDWDDLIRAYEASPLGSAGAKARTLDANADSSEPAEAEETAEITFGWRPAQEGQIKLLEKALKERYPQTEVIRAQFQGPQGATLVFRAPASSAEAVAKAIEAVAAPMVPVGGTMNSTISMVPPAPPADGSQTLVVRLQYASAGETAKLLESLKLDPAIRIASDDRTNSIILSAPPATKYAHVQAAIALLEKLDQPVAATPGAENGAAKAPPDRAANAAKLRSDLTGVEADVQRAAEAARAASDRERREKVDDLRRAVAQAFALRLTLQREEAADLRDRLAKIEENLARRERIENAVIDRRVEVLLDPALEWPETAGEEPSSPRADVASLPAGDAAERAGDGGADFERTASDVQGRGDSFAAATSLAREISELTGQAQAIERDGTPDGSEVRLALIRRQLELLRQEFDAREQALKLELESLKAKLTGAQASYDRTLTLVDTGAVPQGELAKVEVELQAAQSDVARQEVVVQQYERASASLPGAMTAESDASEPGDDASAPSVDPASLQGTWRQVRASRSNGPLVKLKQTVTWQFDGQKLIYSQRPKPDWLNPTTLTIEHSPQTPGVFLQQGEKDDARILQGRFEVRGDTLRVAVRHDRFPPGPLKQVAPAEGVDYYELERIKDDEGATTDPAGTASGSASASSISVTSESVDRSAVTALVLRVADLHLEIRRLQSQDPAPPHRDLAIEMLTDQIERLRKDLDVRQKAVRERRPDAASKFAVAQARFDRAQRLSAQNLNASQELAASEAELASARDDLDQIDAAIAAYDEGRKSIDEAATSETLPADFADDANGSALKKLQGFWMSVEESGPHRFGTSRPEHARLWLFAGNVMIERVLSFGAGSLGDVKVVAGADSRGELTFVFDGLPEYSGVTAYIYRFDGGVLKVARKEQANVANVAEAAPQPGVQFYAFARSDAVESLIAAFDADAVDTKAIENACIDLAITSQEEQRLRANELASGTKSLHAPVRNAKYNLRSLAKRLVSARETWDRSGAPDLTQEERRRLRSQSFGLRAEWDDERDHFFAQKFYIERALASLRTRIESETSEAEREKLSTTGAKLADCLATIDELARIARLPSPVSLGQWTGEPWHPLVNAEERAFQLDLPLEVHANELRKCEERIVDPAYDDAAREREVARRDYLKEGAREIRRIFAAALSGAEGDLDKARTELNQAKRGQGLYGESLDDVDREFTIAREEYRLERTTLAVEDYGRRLKEIEAAFPFLLQEPAEAVPEHKAIGRPSAASTPPATTP